jgi:hypothetical protein
MNELTSLSTLTVEIDALNEQANIYANQALVYAAKCGQKLLLAKAQCNHGQFKSWLDENCKTSYTVAKKYMRLAADMPQLLDSKGAASPLLGLSQAIELLSATEEVKTEVTTRIEAGEDVTIKEIQRLKKEAVDLLAEKQVVQNYLISKTQQAEELQRKVNFQALTVESVEKQNTELRNRDQSLIDAKVSEEKVKLLLENSAAMQAKQKEIDDAKDALSALNELKIAEINKLKNEQDKAITDGIGKKMLELDSEIRSKEQSIYVLEKRTVELLATYSSLDKEVGLIQVHKQILESAKTELQAFTISFAEAFDTAEIPTECFGDWQSIHYAIKKISKQLDEFIGDNSPIESSALIGELVN